MRARLPCGFITLALLWTTIERNLTIESMFGRNIPGTDPMVKVVYEICAHIHYVEFNANFFLFIL